jgi:maltose O-acetyltransferase
MKCGPPNKELKLTKLHVPEREWDKMLRGELYLASDSELVAARVRARRLWAEFNRSDPADDSLRARVLSELLGGIGSRSSIEPPFYCDYGSNVVLGDDVFVNFGAVFLDPGRITLGHQVQLGPMVQLLTADHPRKAALRVAGPELARPITIGSRAWLGGGVIVCPGVTIGEEAVVGAGSVVVRDVPAGVVAAGNPCRVIKKT